MSNMNGVIQLIEELAQFLMRKVEGIPTDNRNILEIETLDNPGWMVASPFVPGSAEAISDRKSVGTIDEESRDWWTCFEQKHADSYTNLVATDDVIMSYGGPRYLSVIVEKVYSRVVHGVLNENVVLLNDGLIEDISTWLLVQCDGDWEHSEGIKIVLTGAGQWKFQATNVSTHLLQKEMALEKRPRFPTLGTTKAWLRDPVMIDQCWYHDSTDIGGLAAMLETFLNNSELDPAGLPTQSQE